ncbi:MAG: hypothetical protein R6X02_14015 [Enhygromyxa sp.]
MKKISSHITIASLFVMLAACTEDQAGRGDLRVLIEAEDVIIDGLDPGEGVENIRDGWSVRFDQYIVAIGAIDVHLSSDDHVEAEADDLFVIDLSAISAAGESLWSLTDLQAGRWEFSYATRGAGDGATRHANVSEDDFSLMAAEDLTYLIRGRIEQTDGKSCPPASLATPPAEALAEGSNAAGDPCYPAPVVSFEIAAEAETRYGPCEVDEVPGFSVTAGSETSVAITIHGDHLFFNGFPEGGEGGVMRLAQWLADCDLDLDGTVTQAELEAISPSDLVELDARYQLGGSPITPLATMWDYVRAQLKTQGHFQGEGECPIDGVGHEH